jgi:hypothetical protein
VYKELTIIGESREGVNVEHDVGSEELSIRAKNVKISTITFRNFRITNQGQYDYVIITNNVFIIDNEERHWNPEVIYIAGQYNEISDNIMTFTGTYDGSKNPKTGIFMQCYESKITNNIITGVGGGATAIHILDWSYWVDDLVKGKNIIEGNTFIDNGCGIHLTPTLRPGYNSRITHNNFIDNKDNARFVISLPSVVDIIRNNIKRLIYIIDPIDSSDSISDIILSLRYWDENYWSDYDGSGPMIISGSLQSAGIVNQFFHYVLPWLSFDIHPLSEPYENSLINDLNDGKKVVYIEGNCGSYGFGSFLHIGKLWWCPNYPISFGFSPENLYTFEINGIPQEIDMNLRGLQIDMENFFGIAPTLIEFVFLPPRTIFVYGICDEVKVREFE